MSLPAVRDAYTARSAEYIDLLGSIEDAAEQDRAGDIRGVGFIGI